MKKLFNWVPLDPFDTRPCGARLPSSPKATSGHGRANGRDEISVENQPERVRVFKTALIATSAFLFHLSLFYPQTLFWLSFVFLIPLFYAVLAAQKKISFLYGFLWGVIFFSFHLYSVFTLIINECHGAFRYFFPIILAFYVSFHTGLWFWVANLFGTVFSWLISTWLFFMWAPRGLLWASGSFIGYPLMFPLLPLAEHPQTLASLRFFSLELLVLFLICFSMCCAVFFKTGFKKYVLVATFFILPFLFGIFSPPKKIKTPAFFKTFGYVQPPNAPEGTPALAVGQEIYYRIKRLLKKHPRVRYIVMPELSCRFSLNERADIIHLWTVNALRDDVCLLIGACRADENKTYNSLYFIGQGRVQQVYDKKLLMPLAESVPSFYKKFPGLKNLFLKNDCGFHVAAKKEKDFYFKEGFFCKTDICAEAIFAKKSFCNLKSDNGFVLSVFNDSLYSPEFSHLLFLWTTLCGLKQNKFQIFVGYNFAAFTDPQGKVFKLPAL